MVAFWTRPLFPACLLLGRSFVRQESSFHYMSDPGSPSDKEGSTSNAIVPPYPTREEAVADQLHER